MKTMGLIQTEDKGLLRDMHSKALLSCDTGALNRHRRDLARRQRQLHLEADVLELRDTCRQINDRLDDFTRLLVQTLAGQAHGA